MLIPIQKHVQAAIGAAATSGCQKSRRGAVIWHPADPDNFVLGTNSPASGKCDGSEACRAVCPKICVHAEQQALLRSLQLRFPITGAEILHIKIDSQDKGVISGPPSCAECSKLILTSGISGVWLLHAGGWMRYTAKDFHHRTLRELGLFL